VIRRTLRTLEVLNILKALEGLQILQPVATMETHKTPKNAKTLEIETTSQKIMKIPIPMEILKVPALSLLSQLPLSVGNMLQTINTS
tara:strand:- start:270 stop:530 length:261 start_codon:yes stop_codon:yes gene_type:complete